MSSSSASGCASTLVDLRQQLVDRAEWICPSWWGYEGRLLNSRSIVDEAFEQVLRDYPDLHDAVKAQVSVLCQSCKWLMTVISLDIVRRMKIRRVVIAVVLYSRSSIVHDHYRDATSHRFLFYLSPRPAIHTNPSGLRHWACRNRSDAEVFFWRQVFYWRQGKQEQLTVPSLSWSTQSSRSIFEIGTLFHMSRTSNIANLQSKWLQEFLDIHFPEAGIIRGRDHRAQHIFYLP